MACGGGRNWRLGAGLLNTLMVVQTPRLLIVMMQLLLSLPYLLIAIAVTSHCARYSLRLEKDRNWQLAAWHAFVAILTPP